MTPREKENARLREYNARPPIRERRREQARAYRGVHGDRLRAANKTYREEQRRLKPWQKLLQCARARAKAKGIEYSLTPAWARARYDGFCELTGIAFAVVFGTSGPKAFSPSIDRIDQSRGYTQDNCRFVVFAVNAIRGTMTDPEMFELAARLAALAVQPRADESRVAHGR